MNIFGLRYFGIFFLIISFFSFFNIIYSYYFNLLSNLDNYILTFILTLIGGLFLIIFKKYKYVKINLFERILIVLVGYLILPATIVCVGVPLNLKPLNGDHLHLLSIFSFLISIVLFMFTIVKSAS